MGFAPALDYSLVVEKLKRSQILVTADKVLTQTVGRIYLPGLVKLSLCLVQGLLSKPDVLDIWSKGLCPQASISLFL